MLRHASLIFLICLIGCTTMKTWKRVDKLEPATDAYGRAMRWGNYKEATAFIKDTDPGVSFEAFSRIKVTSYKVINREISADQFQAAQAVEGSSIINIRPAHIGRFLHGIRPQG